MLKLDIKKMHIEYHHKTKKYYRVIYDPEKSKKNMFDDDVYIKEISSKTANKWIKKGVQLWRFDKIWDDFRGEIYE